MVFRGTLLKDKGLNPSMDGGVPRGTFSRKIAFKSYGSRQIVYFLEGHEILYNRKNAFEPRKPLGNDIHFQKY